MSKRKLDEDAFSSATSTKKPANLDLLLRLAKTNPDGEFVLCYSLPELLKDRKIKQVESASGGIEIIIEKAEP